MQNIMQKKSKLKMSPSYVSAMSVFIYNNKIFVYSTSFTVTERCDDGLKAIFILLQDIMQLKTMNIFLSPPVSANYVP
jgi:hypothetical protein